MHGSRKRRQRGYEGGYGRARESHSGGKLNIGELWRDSIEAKTKPSAMWQQTFHLRLCRFQHNVRLNFRWVDHNWHCERVPKLAWHVRLPREANIFANRLLRNATTPGAARKNQHLAL